MFSKIWTTKSTGNFSDNIVRLKKELQEADAVLIGAGAGLSTAAGFTYSGERFEKYFSDFSAKYGITDMYSGGFYPFPDLETYWGWWARHIYVNRYLDEGSQVYGKLFDLVKDKDYFVLTTNVDHQFQRAGFDKNRMFYMQGDYGLWQCSEGCHQRTYGNQEIVTEMLLAQGFLKEVEGKYEVDFDNRAGWKMTVPTDLVPHCPRCGEPMTMNLRCDDTFVQDSGWYEAKNRYDDFLRRHENLRVLYLELGTGMNTPVWIKYPFWKMTHRNPKATYACLNLGESYAPAEIQKQSICIDGDIKTILNSL